MTSRIALVVLGVLVPAGPARAEHHHDGGAHPTSDAQLAATAEESSYAAGVQLVAARFDTTTFIGDYQGVVPSIQWARGRLAASANLGLYHLTENGRSSYGIGDLALVGQIVVIATHTTSAGLALPVTAPTGDHLTGFGMGHVMLMPAAWLSHMAGSVMLGASVGYGRALGGASHHDHGAWPLVEPMNMQELTWSASGDVPLGRVIRAGVRLSGGVPIGVVGHDRVVGGVRATWTEGRVETAAELQAGFAGDPFIVRGLVESAVHF